MTIRISASIWCFSFFIFGSIYCSICIDSNNNRYYCTICPSLIWSDLDLEIVFLHKYGLKFQLCIWLVPFIVCYSGTHVPILASMCYYQLPEIPKIPTRLTLLGPALFESVSAPPPKTGKTSYVTYI